MTAAKGQGSETCAVGGEKKKIKWLYSTRVKQGKKD